MTGLALLIALATPPAYGGALPGLAEPAGAPPPRPSPTRGEGDNLAPSPLAEEGRGGGAGVRPARSNPSGSDGTPVDLADLSTYRSALATGAMGPPEPVTFRDLWDHPDSHRGRRVALAGRVARAFRQGPVGAFPALAEVWIASPEGDLSCLVYPDGAGTPAPGPGARVRFAGVFLKRLRYQSGDAARLAPLIVGDRPPIAIAPAAGDGPWGPNPVQWLLGLGCLGLVTLILASRHLGAPRARRRPDAGPAPEWIEPEPAPSGS